MKFSLARLSLRTQLVFWYSAAIAVLFALLFLTLSHFFSVRLGGEIDDSLISHALAVDNEAKGLGATTLEQYGQAVRAGDLQVTTPLGRRALYARLVSPDGSVLLTVPSSFSNAPSPSKEFNPEDVDEFQDIQVPGPGKTRLYSRPLFSSSGEFLGYLEIADSYKTIDQALDKLRRTLLWQALVGAFFAVGMGYVIAWKGLKPLERVVALADEIHDRNLLVRVPDEPRPREIQRLVDSFNDLLERVEKAFERQRLFSAGVSHELRTPLAALRTQIEVMQMDPDLPAELRLRLVELEAEVVRLIQLASNLLLMAQLEVGDVIDRKPVDLVNLLHEVYRETRLLADGRRVVMTGEDPSIVEGDRSLLKQVFLNLLDNAIKYTNENGSIGVSIQITGPSAKVVVNDNGMGIPSSVKPHLFEPFSHIGPRRAYATGGAGLGLAITKRIVDRHRGEITVESVEGAGTTVSVILPLASATEPVTQQTSAHSTTAV